MKCHADFTILDSTSEVESTWWPVSAKASEPVRFAAQWENAEISFLWDFGDGGSSNGKNPVHVFQSPSNNTVVLDVEFPTGWQSRLHTISLATTIYAYATNVDNTTGDAETIVAQHR